MDSIFDFRTVEIYEQPDAVISDFQIRQQLSKMDGEDCLNGLDLYHDVVSDQEIHS